MTITVTARDIAMGKPKHPRSCPIALAMRHQTSRGVFVDSDCIFLNEDRFSLPAKARRFIALFDDGFDVSPMSFELEVPA